MDMRGNNKGARMGSYTGNKSSACEDISSTQKNFQYSNQPYDTM